MTDYGRTCPTTLGAKAINLKSIPHTSHAAPTMQRTHWTPSLPLELWGKVFYECQSEDDYPLLHKSMLSTSLVGVCKTWRALALSYSALWASIGIAIDPGMSTASCQAVQKGFDMWLIRSRSSLLNVAIYYRASCQRLPTLNAAAVCSAVSKLLYSLFRHGRRIRSLLLCIPNQCLPSLQALHLGHMPVLTSLDIQAVGADPSVAPELSSVSMDWSRLTTLHLTTHPRITLDECHRILTKASSLKSCSIVVEAPTLPRSESFEPVELPTLRTLRLRLTGSSATLPSSFAPFFSSIQLQTLEELDISCLYECSDATPSLTQSLISLIQRTAQTLATLRLTNIDIADKMLLSLLSHLRRLSALELNFPLQPLYDPISEEFIAALDLGHEESTVLPNLAGFKLECHGERYAEEVLINMITSRMRGSDIASALRSFDLFSTRRASSSLRFHVQDWQEHGLQISIDALSII